MKRLFRTLAAPALLVLALSAAMLVPTAASAMNEHRDGFSRSRGWDGERVRQRYSRYWDDEDEARPRRRLRTETLERRHRAAQQRKNRFAAQTRQRRQVKQQDRRRVVHKRPAIRQVARPAPQKRAVSKKWPPPVTGSHGIASYYWQPQRLAAGGWFNPDALTAAHRTLPFGTRVRVTHVASGKSVEVKINDRGPYIAGRIIDLSRAAAGVIGMTQQGIARVAVEVLGR
jgi:rare lipoprotein A